MAGVKSSLLVLMLSAQALAQNCPPPEDAPALAGLAPKARLDFIRGQLTSEAHRVRVWKWGWIAGYGALTVGQLIPIPLVSDPGLRIDFAIGAISSAAGVALLLAFPLHVGRDASVVEALADDCAGVLEAERIFADDAENERDGRHWLVHVGNVALNAVFGLVLGLGFGRWLSGLANFLGGVLLGELTCFTQPNRLTDARARYGLADFAVVPTVSPQGLGLQLVAQF
jgi:hypothetical protein